MALNFKAKTNGETPFTQLVHERVALERELRHHNSERGRRLTPTAYVRQAIKNAESTQARVEKLRSIIEAEQNSCLHASMRLMCRLIADGHAERPPTRWEIGRLLRQSSDEQTSLDLMGLGYNTMCLYAAAAMLAAETTHGAFGDCENSANWDERWKELNRRREELDQQLASAYNTVDDVHYSEPNGQGMVKVVLKAWPEVSIFPNPADLGQRLAQHILRMETASAPNSPLGG